MHQVLQTSIGNDNHQKGVSLLPAIKAFITKIKHVSNLLSLIEVKHR